jgi:hypothetical protein
MVLTDLRKQTIQELPEAEKNAGDLFFLGTLRRGPLLPAWGTRDRERTLRDLYRHDYNWMVQGAFAGVMKKIASTPWEIKGPEDISAAESKYWRARYKAARFGDEPDGERPDIEYWQEVLRQADFGRGWTSFIQKGVDYLRHDSGWFWELIAPGDPRKPPSGPVTGIAHLDALRCLPTGDPEYPVLYYDRKGKLHLLHYTRVVQLVDMPDGDEHRPGYGLCALSRAVSIVSREILMGRYIESSLDDKPGPGIVVTNLNKSERGRAFAEYQREQNSDERPEWGRQLWFYSPDPQFQVQLETKAFSTAPEKFGFNEYTLLDVNAMALALGVDVQELWQLTGGTIGSGEQSEILSQKSRGKAIGTLYAMMERALNDILPEEYEFAFKLKDDAEANQTATLANLWADVAGKLRADMDANEIRVMLANQVEAIKDAITDENGEVRRVQDVDVQPQEQIVDDTSTQDIERPGSGQQQPAAGANGNQPPQPSRPVVKSGSGRGMDSELGWGGLDSDQKAIQSTRLEFEAAFADVIQAFAIEKSINRTRFGIIARNLLRVYGGKAFLDAMEESGIQDAEMDIEDRAFYSSWLTTQSNYVTDFARTLPIDPVFDPQARATMWWNKSVMGMYQYGKVSADKNGLYMWVYGDTEHCDTCLRLNGQKHRLKDWYRKGLMPKSDRLACKGYFCACSLVRTTGRAMGGF